MSHSLLQRHGARDEYILVTQSNLALTYAELGRVDEAMRMRHEVYSGSLRLNGEGHEQTLGAAFNYASTLCEIRRFEEARSLLRRTLPVARRVLGANNENTHRMRKVYAKALFMDDGATLDDLREAVTTLEDAERISRRVMGGAHPTTENIEDELQDARAALHSIEAPRE